MLPAEFQLDTLPTNMTEKLFSQRHFQHNVDAYAFVGLFLTMHFHIIIVGLVDNKKRKVNVIQSPFQWIWGCFVLDGCLNLKF